VRHAAEQVLNVLAFFGAGKTTRQADDNRIVTTNGPGVLIPGSLDPVAE
jgi:hypothetical protein